MTTEIVSVLGYERQRRINEEAPWCLSDASVTEGAARVMAAKSMGDSIRPFTTNDFFRDKGSVWV